MKMNSFTFLCFFILSVVLLDNGAKAESPLYKFVMKDIRGKNVSLSQYKGKVLMVVNVASECIYTDNHYKELVELYNQYSKRGFTILAFPCNQYGQQEPKDDAEILKFVQSKYKVKFPVFSKIEVGGEPAHPLFIFLYKSVWDYPKWNFGKYLIDRQGKVVKFLSKDTNPKQCSGYIETLLSNKTIDEHQDL